LNNKNNQSVYSDEIDLNIIFGVLWAYKIFIFFIISIAVAVGIIYLQNAEQKYFVRITYQQIEDTSKADNNLGATLLGRANFGPLVGLMPASSNADFEALKYLLTSEEVAENIFTDSELIAKIFSDEYDTISNTFKKPETGKLSSKKNVIKSFITGREYQSYRSPDIRRLMEVLKESFSIKVSDSTGFLMLSGETSRPSILVELMEAAILEADSLVKKRYVESSTQALLFYQKKISRAKSRVHRDALASLIASEEKKLMLSSTGKSFVVKPISRPQISLNPTKPNPSLILALCIIMGFFCSIILVIAQYAKKRK